jgi:hypothetical protein
MNHDRETDRGRSRLESLCSRLICCGKDIGVDGCVRCSRSHGEDPHETLVRWKVSEHPASPVKNMNAGSVRVAPAGRTTTSFTVWPSLPMIPSATSGFGNPRDGGHGRGGQLVKTLGRFHSHRITFQLLAPRHFTTACRA